MEKRIDIKPLSTNKLWQGRRYKTEEYKSYENQLLWLLKGNGKTNGWVDIVIKVFVRSYAVSDVDNFAKPLLDIIVKAGLIDDDRFVKKLIIEKFKSKTDYLIIIINETYPAQT